MEQNELKYINKDGEIKNLKTLINDKENEIRVLKQRLGEFDNEVNELGQKYRNLEKISNEELHRKNITINALEENEKNLNQYCKTIQKMFDDYKKSYGVKCLNITDEKIEN